MMHSSFVRAALGGAALLALAAAPAHAQTATTLSWTSLVNATASGTTLKKSSGCGTCSDAGAVSAQSFASGSVAFTVSAGARAAVGMGSDASTNTSYAFNYSFSFNGGSTWEIREAGVYKTEGPLGTSDVFTVSADGVTVRYYRNSSLVYTSKIAQPGPMVVDTTLVNVGATVQVSQFLTSGTTTTSSSSSSSSSSSTGISWTNLVKATASGGTIKKNGGCYGCADSGGTSQQQLTSGAVSFTVPAGQELVAGLSRDTSSNTSYAIDYAFSFNGSGTWEIRERGSYKTEGSFSSSDTFTLSIEGTKLKYYRNGSLVYTSGTAVSSALVADVSLLSTSASVTFTGGGTTSGESTPPPPPPPPPPSGSSTTLRVLQWNTHHGGYGTDGVYDTDRVANWIVAMKPDVVMLNEIEKYTSWGNEDQPAVYKALLQQKTGKTWYSTFSQEFGQWSSNGKGSLILSTYPISYKTNYELVNNYDRSIGLATITVNNRPITLMITHLDPYDASLRLIQAQEVTSWAAPQPENRIITGDMNAWPDQTSIAHFNSLYYDSWAVAASNGTASAFSGNYGETKNGRIDYIFYSKSSSNLVVKSSQVYDTRDSNGYMPSDHRPVLTTFEVR
jgi:endonuclease/exonuclease/phosphatase family metal-dependent hydrolase